MTVLTDFLNIRHNLSSAIILDSEICGDVSVSITKYLFSSQIWPVSELSAINITEWRHRINIFRPYKVSNSKVLLYVSSGYIHDNHGDDIYKNPVEKLDFLAIAKQSRSVVVELQDVPNQYLITNEGYKKEDGFLAYTYKLFMETGDQYIIGRLPMIKSIIKAMDFVQHIANDMQIQVESFVLAGMSKRGWAIWLAAIEDERVSGIIPVVIDVLNSQKNLQYICSIYAEGCPYAFKDYTEQGITKEVLGSDAFQDLMGIEDPLQYLNYGEKYKKQIEKLSKYIINASGDDFFVPDSSRFYFQALPGQKHIRYLPNALHYMAGNPVSDALGNMQKVSDAVGSYFALLVDSAPLPEIEYLFAESSIQVNVSQIPDKAILWVAHNPDSRDFRFLSSYSTPHLIIKKLWSYFSSNLCDRCYYPYDVEVNCDSSPCEITVSLPNLISGYQASFLEFNYSDFIITTEIYVTGNQNSVCEV